MLGEQQIIGRAFGKSCVAHLPCRRFQTEAILWVDRNMPDNKGNPKPETQATTKFCPAVRMRRQAVMHMDSRKRRTETNPVEDAQQDNRITASGEPDAKLRPGAQTGSEKIAYPLLKVSRQAVP